MGVVKYATGIDYVKGSLAKPTKRAGHKCGTYLIGNHREAPTSNPNCTRLFVKNNDVYERTTDPTQNELTARMRFSEVSSMVKARKKDLNHITQDQQAFIAQKDLPGGKVTLRAYLWKICGEEYDSNH